MPPFLSVCIPTFNRAELLRRCLESLVCQPGDFEIVVSDNASRDHTADVVNEITDARVRYIQQPRNVGAIDNFVSVIGQATGEYVCVITDDDWATPGSIAQLSGWLSLHRPDVMKTDLIFLSDSRKVSYLTVGKEIQPDDSGPEAIRELLSVFHVWTGLCFRASALDYETFSQRRPEWYPHLLILGMLNSRAGYLPEPLFVHREDSELFHEAHAGKASEPFLNDLAATFEVLEGQLDPRLTSGMALDAVKRLSHRANHLVDISPIAEFLPNDWPSERRKLRLAIRLTRGWHAVVKGLRRVFDRVTG